MMAKKVLVIIAHSPSTSFGSSLGEAYAASARESGHNIKTINLHELKYDPILHDGYRTVQKLEPDLLTAQDAIQWADHIAFLYPIWWGSLPAILKGFVDRVFLPGFAFKYDGKQKFPEKLLKGKSAHILATMDTPPWYYHMLSLAPGLRQMKKLTLEFCGIQPVKAFAFGPILDSSEAQRGNWLKKAKEIAVSL